MLCRIPVCSNRCSRIPDSQMWSFATIRRTSSPWLGFSSYSPTFLTWSLHSSILSDISSILSREYNHTRVMDIGGTLPSQQRSLEIPLRRRKLDKTCSRLGSVMHTAWISGFNWVIPDIDTYTRIRCCWGSGSSILKYNLKIWRTACERLFVWMIESLKFPKVTLVAKYGCGILWGLVNKAHSS